MKELNKDQVELLIRYMTKQIKKHRRTAEKMRESAKTAHMDLGYESMACELERTLAYLMGLLYEER